MPFEAVFLIGFKWPIKNSEVSECTIESIQSALKAGSLTCVQLVELYLARIKAFNGQSVRYGTPADPFHLSLCL